MDLKLRNACVVVLSEGSNPKLLSHDFLARNDIVPEDWQIRDIVVTPPFSQILYENRVQFVVEINKLQVRVNKPDLFPWEKDSAGNGLQIPGGAAPCDIPRGRHQFCLSNGGIRKSAAGSTG
jgi:hypothetical protein